MNARDSGALDALTRLLAPGTEVQPVPGRSSAPSGTLLAGPGQRGCCQLDESPAALAALLATATREPAALADRHGPAAVGLVAELRAGGFLPDSPPPSPPRRVVLTADGVEFAGADRVAAAVYRTTRPLCTRAGVLTLAALTIFGVTAPLAAGWATVSPVRGATGATALPPVVAAIALLALQLVVVVVHELGHAVVLAHYGRRIGRVGIGLYWGAVCFYVDATAAFFLPRTARVRQAAAGPLVEGALAGLLVPLVWLLPAGPVPTLLTQTVRIAALGVVLNLVPLLKLDGYWVLADALDMPDLQEQCTAALRRVTHGSRTRPDLTRAAYALASVLFGLVALGYGCWLWARTIAPVAGSAWSAGLLGKVLAAALVVPLLGLLAQAIFAGLRALVHRTSPPVSCD